MCTWWYFTILPCVAVEAPTLSNLVTIARSSIVAARNTISTPIRNVATIDPVIYLWRKILWMWYIYIYIYIILVQYLPEFICIMAQYIPPGVVSGGSMVGSVLEESPKRNTFSWLYQLYHNKMKNSSELCRTRWYTYRNFARRCCHHNHHIRHIPSWM